MTRECHAAVLVPAPRNCVDCALAWLACQTSARARSSTLSVKMARLMLKTFLSAQSSQTWRGQRSLTLGYTHWRICPSPKKTIPEQIEYVDIAGLVKGASKGEGLGNKFLSNIREVDAIVHVVRCFEDDDITHVDGSINPARDIETINLELMLADLDQCENRLKKLEKDVKNKVKGADVEQNAVLKVKKTLEEFKPARVAELNEKEEEALKSLPMLTKKRVIYAANVSEDDLAEGNNHVESVRQVAAETGDEAVIVSAQVEAELCGLDAQERAEFLETLGVEESGCNNLIRETYQTLGLRTYYTTGPQESRAWTIRAGWKAPQAAGVIHTDFEEGFIKAATVSYDMMVECGSEEAAASKGKLRIEGKDYVVQDGDVMHFRFK